MCTCVLVTLAGCDWFDSLFARDAGEPPPLPPPPVLPTPVGPPETPTTPETPPTPPVADPTLAPDGDGGVEAGAAVASEDAGADPDSGLAAVTPTPVAPAEPPPPEPSTPSTPSTPRSSGGGSASCRAYERCCRALGGSGGLAGLAGGCRDMTRRVSSPDADRLCRQALSGIRAAVSFLPNAPRACR